MGPLGGRLGGFPAVNQPSGQLEWNTTRSSRGTLEETGATPSRAYPRYTRPMQRWLESWPSHAANSGAQATGGVDQYDPSPRWWAESMRFWTAHAVAAISSSSVILPVGSTRAATAMTTGASRT